MSSTCPCPMRNTISSNPMPRSAFSFSFFASSQVKYCTELECTKVCAFKAHIGHQQIVPLFVPTPPGICCVLVRNADRRKARVEPRVYWSKSLSTTQAQIVPTQLLTGGLLVRIQPEEPHFRRSIPET